jgi:hypothetical protein
MGLGVLQVNTVVKNRSIFETKFMEILLWKQSFLTISYEFGEGLPSLYLCFATPRVIILNGSFFFGGGARII